MDQVNGMPRSAAVPTGSAPLSRSQRRRRNRLVVSQPQAPLRRAPRSAAIGRALGALGGSYFGPAGAAVGGMLGDLAGDKFGVVTGLGSYSYLGPRGVGGRVSGLGAYVVNRNTILAPDPPEIRNTDVGVRIRHREYLLDVTGSTAFSTVATLPIQPGLASSFPWLSGVAANYQQWKPHGILYEFITTSGNSVASSDTALGEVVLATQYNSLLPPFTNKQQMLNQQFASTAVPSVDIIHPIECDPEETTLDKLYVRTTPGGISTINGDLRMADLGAFQIATIGQQVDDSTLGSLFVTYDIEFFKPTLIDNTSASIPLYLAGWTGATGTNPYGTTLNVGPFGQLPVTQNPLTGGFATLTIAPAAYNWYVVFLGWSGSQTTGAITPPATTSLNATIHFASSLSPSGPLPGDVVGTGGSIASFVSVLLVEVTDLSLPWTLRAPTGSSSSFPYGPFSLFISPTGDPTIPTAPGPHAGTWADMRAMVSEILREKSVTSRGDGGGCGEARPRRTRPPRSDDGWDDVGRLGPGRL